MLSFDSLQVTPPAEFIVMGRRFWEFYLCLQLVAKPRMLIRAIIYHSPGQTRGYTLLPAAVQLRDERATVKVRPVSSAEECKITHDYYPV